MAYLTLLKLLEYVCVASSAWKKKLYFRSFVHLLDALAHDKKKIG